MDPLWEIAKEGWPPKDPRPFDSRPVTFCSLTPNAMQARKSLNSICEEFLRTLPAPPFVVSYMKTDTRICTQLFTSPSGVIFTAHAHWIFTTDEDGYFMETISLPGVPVPVYTTWRKPATYSIAEGRWKSLNEHFKVQ